jgi:hypothetical protein
MHHRLSKLFIGALFLFLVGCGPVAHIAPAGGGEATSTPAPIVEPASEATEATVSPPSGSEQPPSPLALVDNKWQMFSNRTDQVLVEYPVAWTLIRYRTDSDTEEVRFSAFMTESVISPSTYLSLIASEAVPPFELQPMLPNRRDITVFGQTSLVVPNAKGLVYLYGIDCEGCDGTLTAVYYSAILQMSVVLLTGPVPRHVIQEVIERGLETTLQARYPEFGHMIRSIRFQTP